ncbi:MAG: ATP-binding protein, partial [Bacteroidota bacterium]
MVLEIRLSNFFSIKEEIILDFRAGNLNSEKARSLQDNCFHFKKDKILKVAAIYGPNASGKSNIIEAIRFCQALIFESHIHNADVTFNFRPFKFDHYPDKPSTYFIRFVLNEVEYEYSFSLTQEKILKESLFYYPNGRRAKIFARDEKKGQTKKEKYSFSPSVVRRPMVVAESTSEKNLFLSRASQMDRALPKEIYQFFHRKFIRDYSSYTISHIEQMVKKYKQSLLGALQFADSDIVDIKLKRYQTPPPQLLTVEILTGKRLLPDIDNLEIKTYHKSHPEVAFDFMTEESQGTQHFFFMMLNILEILEHDKFLLIDEIEDSLHPGIVEYIIKIFHAGAKAQLLFSTHNTNLLDLSLFRKDQIWFVNKIEDG